MDNRFVAECLIFLIVVLIVYLFRKRKFLVLAWKLPGPVWLPIIGNAHHLMGKTEDIFDMSVDVVNRFPSPMRFILGPKLMVIISDPHNAEQIMNSTKFATKDEDIYGFMGPFLGSGLLSGSGLKYKRDRKLLGPLFNPKNLSRFFPIILEHTLILRNILEKKVDEHSFNALPIVQRCVADFMNESIVGRKTNAQLGGQPELLKSLKTWYKLVYVRIIKIWLRIDIGYRLSQYWKIHKETVRCLQEFFGQAISIARSRSTDITNQISVAPLVDQIVDIQKRNPDFGTDQDMIDHLFTIFTAAEDAVSLISSFALLLLGMYPDIQAKVVEEIHDVIGSNKRNIQPNDLLKLGFLDMVVKEVLRLFPVAPFVPRMTDEDFNLDGTIIPKDCSVVVAVYIIHKDDKHWEKPNDFYPDHFLPEAVAKRHPYAYMPFSAGPRSCVGKFYGNMALKIILVTILQTFQIEADGKLEDIKLKQDMIIRKKDEMYPIRLVRRQLDG